MSQVIFTLKTSTAQMSWFLSLALMQKNFPLCTHLQKVCNGNRPKHNSVCSKAAAPKWCNFTQPFSNAFLGQKKRPPKLLDFFPSFSTNRGGWKKNVFIEKWLFIQPTFVSSLASRCFFRMTWCSDFKQLHEIHL